MAIGTYSELKTAISDWMARSDISGSAADFVTLAEARLNREIGAVETDTTLTATISSRRIDLSSVSMVSPIALFRVDGTEEVEVIQQVDGTFPYSTMEGAPRFWAIDGEAIDFDRPCDQAYSFRFRFRQRFALSDAAPTNWLLTNHPDVYLAAGIVWGGAYVRSQESIALFKNLLDEAIPSIKRIIGRKNRGRPMVDPALMPTRSHYRESDFA